MKKKNGKTARRGGRARKPSGAPTETAHSGMAAQLLGKVGASTASIAESLQGGLKKLEDVFDQRVLSSLSHAGMPSPAEIRELMERVELLSAQVKRLSRGRSKG